LLELNVPQQAFTLFYPINWGTAANSQPRWKAFAWGAIGEDLPSRWRACLSIILLNLLPLTYFVVLLGLLDSPTRRDLNQWDWRTTWRVFVSILPSFAPFGFYRIWTGVVQRRNQFFYGSLPTKDTDGEEISSQIWQEIGLELKTESDLNAKWGLSNILWGVVYVFLGLGVVVVMIL
jgi:hypothetical protein